MSKRLPPLNALRVFDAAARHLSFTRAADELFVTQAAVSHQIKSLEDFLGLKLFRRRNRSLLLTEEGQSYFQDIKEIFSQLTEATRKLQARSAKGALTVSLLPSFAIQWLVPRLTSFNSAYPGIDVRIQAVDRQEDKLADDVDVAIFYGRGNWPGLRVEKLYAEYLLPVCSPLLLTGEKALKTPADLAKHTLLHDASRRDWQTYTRQLGLNHINVQQGPIFSHSAMVLQAAIHGQGVALANNVMAQSEIEAGRLVCPFNDVLVSKNAFYLVISTNVTYYMLLTYMPSYLSHNLHYSEDHGVLIIIAIMVGMLFVQPIMGLLSDRFGRRPFIILGSIALFALAIPAFILINSNVLGLIFAGLLMLAVILNCFIGVMASTLPAMFPTHIRYSALAAAFNISVLIAGLTPTLAASLVESTQNLMMPAYYLMVIAAIGLATGLTMKETANRPLKGATPAASDIAEAKDILREHYDNVEQKIEDIDAEIEELQKKRSRLVDQHPRINE
jgi:LysR family glycine cleavage system transcriptional activator